MGAGGAGGGANGQGTIDEISGDTAVKVAVLVRPMLEFEKQKGAQDVVSVSLCNGRRPGQLPTA